MPSPLSQPMLAEETEAYLGLGANLGNREENIFCALKKLANLPTTQVVRVSSLYETAPVGVTDQPDFLNAAAHVRTTLSAPELLAQILQIEREMGRVRTLRWGPRTIDIDILAFGTLTRNTPELILPHPRLHERAFALTPLAEIAPDLVLPGQKKTVQKLLDNLPIAGTMLPFPSSKKAHSCAMVQQSDN